METKRRIVQEIPVLYRPNMQTITKKEVVCGYARVSTDNEEQEDSFERQVEHFTKVINNRSDWEFGGVYADPGITGTRADKREQFQKMLIDCRAGKINRILVKSISRFARNTVDTLMYIRELKELGISVYFETQNIDTLTPGGEILITILAAIAEQESRTMSTNIKWAYQKRFREGEVLINFKNTLGYTKVGNEYVVVDEEAEIVRRIFREYIGGATYKQIANGLMADGINTGMGNEIWSDSSVQGILMNEKYTGNAILGKSFKSDVLSKTRQVNKGQAPMYYVQNSHPAIISQEIFDMASAERENRRTIRSSTKTGEGRYTSKYALSGLLICGNCGSKFRRYGRKLANGEKVATWVCINHQNNNHDCTMQPLKEVDIIKAYKQAVERLSGDVSDVIEIVKNNIAEELKPNICEDLEQIEHQIIIEQNHILELFQRKRNNTILQAEYDRDYKVHSDVIIELKAKESELKKENIVAEITKKRMDDIVNILISEGVDYTSPVIMKAMVECIRVIDKHHIELQFKCGINMQKDLTK